MPVPLSTAAKAILARKSTRVERRLEIVRELLNADLRAFVDVTDEVEAWGTLTGDSTLKRDQWEIPAASFTLAAGSGDLVPGSPESLWTVLGSSPTDCWVKVRLWVVLPNGAEETIHTYYGKITEASVRKAAEIFAVDLTTIWAGDEALAVGISKQTGDELVKEGGAY